MELNLSVENGSLRNIAAGFTVLDDATINTGATLADVAGVSVTPAVGDLILRVSRTGTGQALIHYGLWYRANG
jgi:hypothetical protein